jgi:hypothetical protein
VVNCEQTFCTEGIKVQALGIRLPKNTRGALMQELIPQLEEFRKDFEARNGRHMTREELAYLECANKLLLAREAPSET